VCQPRHRMRYSSCMAISGLMVGAGACYLYLSLEELRLLAMRIVDTAIVLQASSAAPAAAKSFASADVLKHVRDHVAYLDLYFLGAALLVCLSMLVSSLAACRRVKALKCAKLLIALSAVLALLYLVLIAAILLASLFWDRPLVVDNWATFTSFCPAELPGLQAALSDAAAACCGSGQSEQSGQSGQASEVELANTTLSQFEALCGHLAEAPAAIGKLTPATGVVTCVLLLSLFTLTSTCCSAGCCRVPRSNAVAPAPPTAAAGKDAKSKDAKSEESTGEDEEEDDEEER